MSRLSARWLFCSVFLACTMDVKALVYMDYREVVMFGASVNAQLYNHDGLTPAIKEFSGYVQYKGSTVPDVLFGNIPSGHNIVFRPNTVDSTSQDMRYQYDEAGLHASLVKPNSFFGVMTGTMMIGLVGEICSDGDLASLDAIKSNINYMISDFQGGSQRVVLMAYPTDFGGNEVTCPNGKSYMEQACAYNDWAQAVADNNPMTELIDPWQRYAAVDNFHASQESSIIASENVKACFEDGFGDSCIRYDPGNCRGIY